MWSAAWANSKILSVCVRATPKNSNRRIRLGNKVIAEKLAATGIDHSIIEYSVIFKLAWLWRKQKLTKMESKVAGCILILTIQIKLICLLCLFSSFAFVAPQYRRVRTVHVVLYFYGIMLPLCCFYGDGRPRVRRSCPGTYTRATAAQFARTPVTLMRVKCSRIRHDWNRTRKKSSMQYPFYFWRNPDLTISWCTVLL